MPSPQRDVDDEAAGQRDLRRQPRALRLHRVLDGLDEDLLAAGEEVLDAPAVALALQLGADDLVDVEEAVLLETDLDERRLHAGEDVVDDALVDVAGDRAPSGALEVHLGHAVVLEHGDRLLGDVDGDEQLALRRGQRRPAGGLLAPRVRSGARALARRRLLRRRLGRLLLGRSLPGLGLRRLRLALPVASTARSASATRTGLLVGSRRAEPPLRAESQAVIGCCGYCGYCVCRRLLFASAPSKPT